MMNRFLVADPYCAQRVSCPYFFKARVYNEIKCHKMLSGPEDLKKTSHC